MRVLIVYAHPEPTSFTGALKTRAVEALTRAGHEVDQVQRGHCRGRAPVAVAVAHSAHTHLGHVVSAPAHQWLVPRRHREPAVPAAVRIRSPQPRQASGLWSVTEAHCSTG